MLPSSFTPSGLFIGLRNLLRNDQMILGLLSVVVGLVGGGLVIALRESILFFQANFYGAPGERLYDVAATLPWWQLLLVPTAGGLAVGLLVHYLMPNRRGQGVADVIEASALKGGKMSLTTGFYAALINALSIGSGASVGREGPAVHLGASLAAWVSKQLHLSRSLARTILGCGVAAAVAGSFNAPLAGALFASEVVIGHYALKAFAPVVIASVTGTALSRSYYGDFPAFVLPPQQITSHYEFFAFIVLGVLAGLAASLLMRSVFFSQDQAQRLPVPAWVRPAIGGFLVGCIALVLPQVLGVGYGITDDALSGSVGLWLLLAVLIGKIVATGLSLGFGFGGGIFSPSLVVGAMLGAAFGLVVEIVFPGLSAGVTGYTLVGMGAVAAAVLGAPISTTLIIFEMTGDYEITTGVMLAVVVSTGITRQISKNNFFALQLESRGLDLKGGFERALLRANRVCDVMEETSEQVNPGIPLSQLRVMLQDSKRGELFVVDQDGKLVGTITLADLSETAFDPAMDLLINAADVARRNPPVLACNDHLESALSKMSDTGEAIIAVVDDLENCKFLGAVEEKHVMAAYNRALLQSRHEERDV
ncbi:MAG: chloride channel protein [Magnetovibrio sp.]|nr:chloride channel protein [Magnetovibrio sp.]